MLVRSFREIRKLKLKLKRDSVQITKAGGFFKARFYGHANCVFGFTAEEARARLLNTPSWCVTNNHRNADVRQRNLFLEVMGAA